MYFKWQEEETKKLLRELGKIVGGEKVRAAEVMKLSRGREELVGRNKAMWSRNGMGRTGLGMLLALMQSPFCSYLTPECPKLLWNFGWGSSCLHTTWKLLWVFWLTCSCSFPLPGSHRQYLPLDCAVLLQTFVTLSSGGMLVFLMN